jgi:hypothetical protein
MSDENYADLESKLKVLDLVVKLGWGLIAGAFAIGVWVATLEIRQSGFSGFLHEHDLSIRNHGTELNRVSIWQAGMEGTKYTASDASRDRQSMQQQLTEHDKRLTRIEDSTNSISKGVERIEQKLQTKP